MFSSEPRCLYRHSPLAEVVCQLRFPEIPDFAANPPVEFQKAIQSRFPVYNLRHKSNVSVPGRPDTTSGINHQFTSADGKWRINLTAEFISLSCAAYTSWETFTGHFDMPLVTFIQMYKPEHFERIGLRYVNFFSRKRLGLEDCRFRDLIHPSYLGMLALEGVDEKTATRSTIDADIATRNGCRVKLHAGPGKVKIPGLPIPLPDPEIKFVFDMDLYMSGKLPIQQCVGAMSTLHAQAYPIFRYAITQRLHDAMEPKTI